ncbi:hypothetical protein HanRHA438_Chr17g0795701 [Helianthus annuus]|nr:hypothetical protein HanRHA438_Chr17g0795701 [Helianthus annuus]
MVFRGCHRPYRGSGARVDDIGLDGNRIRLTDDLCVEKNGAEGERNPIVHFERLLSDVKWTCIFIVAEVAESSESAVMNMIEKVIFMMLK